MPKRTEYQYRMMVQLNKRIGEWSFIDYHPNGNVRLKWLSWEQGNSERAEQAERTAKELGLKFKSTVNNVRFRGFGITIPPEEGQWPKKFRKTIAQKEILNKLFQFTMYNEETDRSGLWVSSPTTTKDGELNISVMKRKGEEDRLNCIHDCMMDEGCQIIQKKDRITIVIPRKE